MDAMTLYALALVASALGFIIFYGISYIEKEKQKKAVITYVSRGSIYSKAEKKFLGVLVRAIGDQCFIMGKVRVADLIALAPGLPHDAKRKAYDKICHESIDFVLTDKLTMKILAGIDLNNHLNLDAFQLKRAHQVDQAFKKANIPLIRFYEKDHYRISDVRYSIQTQVKLSEAGADNDKRLPNLVRSDRKKTSKTTQAA